jgi:diguanylate cyclase
MLSLKKHMDAQVEELLDSALDSYRTSLTAMGKHATHAYPQLGQDLQQALLSLQQRLQADATSGVILDAGREVEGQLESWSARAAEYFKLKAAEIKEMMVILARTAQAVSERDQRYSTQFNEITTRLETIAGFEDLCEIRQSLLLSANELRSGVEKMDQDGRQSVAEMRAELCAYQTKLQAAEELAFRDELTGLDNRREIERQLEQRVQQRRKFCIMMFDLNGFKQINDAHGHLAGDQVLKQFAAELRSYFWPTYIVGRWGGDEFIAVLDCALAAANSRLESVRKWVFGEYKIDGGAGPRKVAVDGAIGLAEWKSNDTVRDVLGRADAAMYKQKAQ